jgi:glycosyltransferase involved in cell wall biosynthesis
MINEVNFVAEINSTSYGEVALNTVKELDKLGVKVNYFPLMGDPRRTECPQEDIPLINKCLNNAVNFDGNAPSVRLWHAHDMAFNVGKGKHYGWTIFELDKFTDRELTHLRSLDGVITCSPWGKGICNENGLSASIVPLAVDHSVFHPNYHKSYFSTKLKADSCVFVNVGKMETRKHSILLKCFEKAFNREDAVELHMIWKNRLLPDQDVKEWESYYTKSKLADKIVLYDWLPNSRSVAAILANADCGVFPSHAEGFNFGLMQAMACGLQVITTDYSAHKMYCRPNNSMLIKVDEVESAWDGKWFHGHGNWAKLGKDQEEQLIEYMRSVYKTKQEGGNLFNAEGFKTASQFTWENTAKRLLEVLNG